MKMNREQSRLFFCADAKIGDSSQYARLGSFCSLTCFSDGPKDEICFWHPGTPGYLAKATALGFEHGPVGALGWRFQSRRIDMAWRICVAATGVLMMVLCLGADDARGQGPIFDLGQTPQATMPRNTISIRIAALQSGIESLDQKLADYKPEATDWRLANRAAARVRQIAVTLLNQVDDKPGTSLMAYYGLMLAQNADAFDELFKKLPLESQALSKNADASIEELIRVDRIRRALNRFVSRGGPNDGAMDPRDFVRKHFSPLLGALKPAGLPAAVNGWLVPGVEPSAGVMTSQQLDDLGKRFADADSAVGKQAGQIIAMLKVGNDFVDLQPQVVVVAGYLDQAAGLVEAAGESDWLTDQVKQIIALELETGLSDYQIRANRKDAIKRFKQMDALSGSLNHLNRLAEAAVNVDALKDLLNAAVVATRAGGNSGAVALRWLDDVVVVMSAQRALPAENLPKVVERIHASMLTRYQAAEQKALDQAAKLAADPTGAGQSEAQSVLTDLESAHAVLAQVALFGPRVNSLMQFPAQARIGIQARLARSIAQLLSSTQQAQAIDTLSQFAGQLKRIEAMAGRATIAKLAETIKDDAALGAAPADVLTALDKYKSVWATAWAKGTDPAEIEANLLDVELTARAAAGLLLLSQAKDPTTVLNQWAGWQANKAANEQVFTKLNTQLQIAIAMLVGGQPGELRKSLEEITSSVPFALAGLIAMSEIGPGLGQMPQGASGVLSQLALTPRAQSFLGSLQYELAVLSRCVNEYSKAKTDADQAALKSLAEHGRWGIGRIMDHLQTTGAK